MTFDNMELLNFETPKPRNQQRQNKQKLRRTQNRSQHKQETKKPRNQERRNQETNTPRN